MPLRVQRANLTLSLIVCREIEHLDGVGASRLFMADGFNDHRKTFSILLSEGFVQQLPPLEGSVSRNLNLRPSLRIGYQLNFRAISIGRHSNVESIQHQRAVGSSDPATCEEIRKVPSAAKGWM
jgi:hypothetical protein